MNAQTLEPIWISKHRHDYGGFTSQQVCYKFGGTGGLDEKEYDLSVGLTITAVTNNLPL